MSFDLNILVNGSRCKQYYHQGKTFIEAKDGSEYVIEVKNNHYKRVLAVGSVDSLNVLTGKTATPNDSGYIIGAYSSEKIKGFRFSDEEWAMFRFGYKFDGKTYAQSKNDGSEKNCGVIGLKFFYEKEPVVIYSSPPVVWNATPSWLAPTPNPTVAPPWVSNPPTTTCVVSASWSSTSSSLYTSSWTTTSVSSAYAATAAYSCGSPGTGGYQNNVNYTCNSLGQSDPVNYQSLFGGCAATKGGGPISPGVSTRIVDNSSTKGGGTTDNLTLKFQKLSGIKGGDKSHKLSGKVKNSIKCSAGGQSAQYSCDEVAVASAGTSDWYEPEYERDMGLMDNPEPKAEFDMGTEWGRKEKSKVNTIPFDKGALACSIDIYYASREALIAMGVPIINVLSAANLPQSFPDKYAQPPAGWVG